MLKADIESAVAGAMDATAQQFEQGAETSAEQFDGLAQDVHAVQAVVADVQAATTRIENKLNPTIEQLYQQEVRIGSLEQAA